MTSLRDRWHSATGAVGRTVDGLPRPVRISGLVAFIAFMYVLPNKWFYEYLNIPGLWIPLYTTRNDMAAVLFYAAWIVLLSLGLNVTISRSSRSVSPR
jgi:branched-chain amino acid transport system permease protein